MTLEELKNAALFACLQARENGQQPNEVQVSLQLDSDDGQALWSSNHVELHYDGDGQTSGCVLTASMDAAVQSDTTKEI
jgi:hypothetical protein